MEWIAGVALAASLGACVSSANMDAKPFQRAVTLAENYQSVYARTNRTMRSCGSVAGGFSVDGQLDSDLGYGEITEGMKTAFAFVLLRQVRINRSGAGTQASPKALTGIKEGSLNWMEY